MNLVTLLALFGAGLSSFAAPCVIPLVPAYLAMMTDPSNHDRRLRPTLLFVAAFAGEFVLFGAFAGLLGHSLVSIQSWTQRIGGFAIAIFGLALLGVFGRLSTGRRVTLPLPRSGTWRRPVVMGIAFGAPWTPCVGPLLGAAVTLAARSSSGTQGAVLLAVYAAGLGAPFVAASLTVAVLRRMPSVIARASRKRTILAGAMLVALGTLLTLDRSSWLTNPIAARWSAG